MGTFERIASAVAGALPIETDLDMGNSNRVKNMPDPVDPTDAATQSEVGSQVESHRQNETHATAQPPQQHGNAAHSADYLTDAPVESVNGKTGAVSLEVLELTEEQGLIGTISGSSGRVFNLTADNADFSGNAQSIVSVTITRTDNNGGSIAATFTVNGQQFSVTPFISSQGGSETVSFSPKSVPANVDVEITSLASSYSADIDATANTEVSTNFVIS